MSHETPLSTIVFQKPDGSTGDLAVHDDEALHEIPAGSVDSENIAASAITTPKLADGAVTEEKLDDGSVTLSKLSEEMQESWDSISQRLNNHLTVKVYNKSGMTVAANGLLDIMIPLATPSGYAAVGIVGWTNNSNDTVPLRCVLEGNNIKATALNLRSYSVSNIGYTVSVLQAKS